MRFEPLGIYSPSVKRGFKIGATMKPLTAGGHLEPAQQQVESRGVNAIGCGMCVERPTAKREPGYEDSGNAAFVFGHLAKLSLGLRIEIVGRLMATLRDPQAIDTFLEFPHRRCTQWWEVCIERCQCFSASSANLGEHLVQDFAFEFDHVAQVLDKSHFEVQ